VSSQPLLEYNASGTYVRVPELREVNITHAYLTTYFITRNNLVINITPMTPTTCRYVLTINYPNGSRAGLIEGEGEPFTMKSTVVSIDLPEHNYVVIEGNVCNLIIPPYAVRYHPTYITPPPDPVIQLFWSIACYSPAIAIFLRSDPRTGGIVILASLPITVPIMYALGADPTILPIFTSFITIISLIMIVMK